MNVSTEEAQKSLEDVAQVKERTETTVAYAGTDLMLLMWGVIWVVGFVMSHVFTQVLPALHVYVGILWLGLIALGGLGSFLFIRHCMPTHNPSDKRIGWLWFFVYFYSWVFLSILWPVLDMEKFSGVLSMKIFGALNSIAPAFAYILMGLYLRNDYLIWIGASVTILTWVGFFFFNPIFWLWMAALGGGVFLVSGIYMRIQLRKSAGAAVIEDLEHA